MKRLRYKRLKYIILVSLLVVAVGLSGKSKPEIYDEYNYGIDNRGTLLFVNFQRGKSHNHPLFVFWLADAKGRYIQTLFVAKSIGKGVFEHINRNPKDWQPGEVQRKAALPYWGHQRGEQNEFGNYLPSAKFPIADAYTGATPQNSFIMYLKTERPLKGKYKVMMEINQPWDWNEYWNNDLYPDNKEYKTSCQPALVYCADIDTEDVGKEFIFQPIGYSHYAGADGSLTTDLSTIITALDIVKMATVKIP